MIRMLVLGIALWLLADPSLFAQTPRDDVMKAEAAFIQVRTKGDKAAYAGLLGDEFVWIDRAGSPATKKENVERLQGEPNPETSKDVRVYGDTAVVTGTAKLTPPDGKPVAVRFVRVWVKRDNRWQAILHQGTAIAQ